MDFDGAIRAHAEWKLKLSVYISSPDKSLDVNTVARDDVCPLGQWIKEETHARAGDSSYLALRDNHAAFHKAAAEVIRHADSGQDVHAEIALGAGSPYAKASQAVVASCMTMKRQLAA